MSGTDRIDIDPPSDDERNDRDYRPGGRTRKRGYRQIIEFERMEHARQNEEIDWNRHLRLSPTQLVNEASLTEPITLDTHGVTAPSMTSAMASSNSASSLTEIYLNGPNDVDYEPNAKRDKPSQLKTEEENEIEIKTVTQPVKELRYKDWLLCFKYQIVNSLDKCIAKLNEKQSTTSEAASSRSKKQTNKENSTSAKQIKAKSATETTNIADPTEKTKFSFHLGQHKFRVKHLNKNFADFELKDDTSIFIYENSRTFRSTTAAAAKSRGSQQSSSLTKFDDLQFYVLLINKNSETSRWLMLYDMDELNRSIFYLITTKTLHAVFNSFEPCGRAEWIGLNIELYLSDKLMSSTLAGKLLFLLLLLLLLLLFTLLAYFS